MDVGVVCRKTNVEELWYVLKRGQAVVFILGRLLVKHTSIS